MTDLTKLARLNDHERIALFTLLQQWSRNSELQAQKTGQWIESKLAEFGRLVEQQTAERCAEIAEYGYTAARKIREEFEGDSND
jgi:hypothetical protein